VPTNFIVKRWVAEKFQGKKYLFSAVFVSLLLNLIIYSLATAEGA